MSEIKLAPEHPPERATLLHHLGCPDEQVVEVAWEDLDRTLEPDHLTAVWIPELSPPVGGELARAVEIVRILRTACPWDAEQTHTSLTRHLLEECYEALEAIDGLGDGSDPVAVDLLEEELGDVLCQVLFHSTIAAEEGLFTLADVAGHLADKLVHRHPHVFSTDERPDATAVLAGWEEQKAKEKGRSGVLDGVPTALPALALSAKYERRARRLGIAPPPDREALAAALAEIAAGDESALGAFLFECARLAVALGIDPEDATRRAAGAFRARVEERERRASSKTPE